MISLPSPKAPPAPPNPPAFGSMMTKGAGQRVRQQANSGMGFGATILGQGNPTNTGQKVLIGQ